MQLKTQEQHFKETFEQKIQLKYTYTHAHTHTKKEHNIIVSKNTNCC